MAEAESAVEFMATVVSALRQVLQLQLAVIVEVAAQASCQRPMFRRR